MTQDEAETIAREAAKKIWSIDTEFEAARYRVMFIAGDLRWEAVGRHAGFAYFVRINNVSGQVVSVKRMKQASIWALTTPQQRADAFSLLWLLLLVFFLFKLPPWVVVAIAIVALVGGLVATRAKLSKRNRAPADSSTEATGSAR